MPNIQSAKKRMRQNVKKRVQNRNKKSSIRTFEKKIRKFTLEKNIEKAKEVLSGYFSLLDKAAKTNLIHKNAASRKKSRLTKLVKKNEAGTQTPAE
ncbi:MAG: 30S ribosomal protein S20 [Spirochaetia bacterium]|nr:30S ribosomal protein S20 [Spirochaetia bacterium]